MRLMRTSYTRWFVLPGCIRVAAELNGRIPAPLQAAAANRWSLTDSISRWDSEFAAAPLPNVRTKLQQTNMTKHKQKNFRAESSFAVYYSHAKYAKYYKVLGVVDLSFNRTLPCSSCDQLVTVRWSQGQTGGAKTILLLFCIYLTIIWNAFR